MNDVRSGLVLGLDTSTVVSVGLARDGEVLGTASVSDRLAHVEQLTPLVRQCLASASVELAEVSGIVVGLGPGPFTGLRVGIVTAQVLAMTRGVPLRGVCSLDVLALQFTALRQAQGTGGEAQGPDAALRQAQGPALRQAQGTDLRQAQWAEFVVATDARRREVYWARYDPAAVRLDGPFVTSPDEVPRLPTVGPAADLYSDRLQAVDGPRVLDPGVLAARGWALPDAGREPLYLRRPDAAEPTRRKSVLHHRAGLR